MASRQKASHPDPTTPETRPVYLTGRKPSQRLFTKCTQPSTYYAGQILGPSQKRGRRCHTSPNSVGRITKPVFQCTHDTCALIHRVHLDGIPLHMLRCIGPWTVDVWTTSAICEHAMPIHLCNISRLTAACTRRTSWNQEFCTVMCVCVCVRVDFRGPWCECTSEGDMPCCSSISALAQAPPSVTDS